MAKQSNKGKNLDNTHFRKILQLMQTGLLETDCTGRIIYLNPEMERITCAAASASIDTLFFPLFSEKEYTAFNENYRKAEETLTPVRFTSDIITPEGKSALKCIQCIPKKNENGFDGMIVTVEDITEHKYTLDRYRELFNNIPLGVAVYKVIGDGRDFIFKDFNQAAVQVDRNNWDDVIGKSVFAVRPGVEKFGLIDVFRKVWKTGEPAHHPVSLYKDDVLTGWYENIVYKLPSGEIVAIFENITERKKTEKALMESESHLKDAQRLAQMGSFYHEVGTDSIWWSEELFRLHGLEPRNTPLSIAEASSFLHPAEKNAESRMWQKAIENKGSSESECRIVRPDQTIRILRVIIYVKTDDRNQPIEISGVIQDITERKKLTEYLEQNQKLEALGILAGGIAHDFNNLLGGIFGYIDLAEKINKDEHVSDYLAKTLATIERARSLTHQLLTFAKGGEPVCSIGKLFPFIRETAQFALSGINISCLFDVPEDLWQCNFDRNQIAQVIDNILINSRQAMPAGGLVFITAANVTLDEQEVAGLHNGNYVKISIMDSGIGIPAGILPRIFDPFFTTKQKGSGLGLAACYSIIIRHNGYIEAQSEQGKGATFSIYLPAVEGEHPAGTDIEIADHRGSGKILVMDDEETIRETISAMLGSMGYTVIAVKDGREVLRLLKTEEVKYDPFRAFILDLTIPGGMNGKETGYVIRSMHPDVPVFISSGYSEDPLIANPGDYGFSGSIRKPFRISELVSLLERHLHGDKGE